jgi:competence protein ComEA
MKNTPVSVLAWACLLLAAFLAGMFVGRNVAGGAIYTSVLTTPDSSQGSTQGTFAPALPSNPAASEGSGLVNINTADIHALMTLPGIGETYAKSIIAYRQVNGPFKDIEDIMDVTGIGEKRFNAIKDLITTGG